MARQMNASLARGPWNGRIRIGKLLEMSLLHLVMLAISTLMFLPFLWMVLSSFKGFREILSLTPTLWPKRFTLVNYQTIMTQLPFPRYFLNSFGMATTITAIVLFTSSLCGYVFAKFEFFLKNFLFTFIISSMMIPFAVVVLPLYLMIARMHLTNNYVGLVLPSFMSAFGVFLMRQFMEAIPSELVDAARIDGAGEMWIYWQIMIPLSMSALSALGVFTFLWSWNNLWWPLMIISQPAMRPLPLGIASLAWEFATRTDLVVAGAAIAVVPVLVLFMLMTRTIVRGVALTGMK